MPHTHHSHSGQFCKHASGSLKDVVIEAIRQGFQVYGLTEYVPGYRLEDLYTEEAPSIYRCAHEQFDDYVEEAHRLKALYASQIQSLVGLETDFIMDADLDGLHALLEKHGSRIEYIVDSVHYVNAILIDFDVPTFQMTRDSLSPSSASEETKDEAFLSAYFDAQHELLRHFKPEIVGHFDLCRLYAHELDFTEFSAVWRKIERNIEYAIGCGAIFEVNAAAFRKKSDTAYPAQDIVKLVLEHGGRFALSDDSHGPHAVGLNYYYISPRRRRF